MDGDDKKPLSNAVPVFICQQLLVVNFCSSDFRLKEEKFPKTFYL